MASWKRIRTCFQTTFASFCQNLRSRLSKKCFRRTTEVLLRICRLRLGRAVLVGFGARRKQGPLAASSRSSSRRWSPTSMPRNGHSCDASSRMMKRCLSCLSRIRLPISSGAPVSWRRSECAVRALQCASRLGSSSSDLDTFYLLMPGAALPLLMPAATSCRLAGWRLRRASWERRKYS
eukprot:Rmarinus@m.11798